MYFKEFDKNNDETIIFSEFLQLIKKDENVISPLIRTRQYYRRIFLSESTCKRIEKRVNHYKFANSLEDTTPPADSCWLRLLSHFNKSYHPYYFNYKLMDDASSSFSQQLDIYLFKLCQMYCPSLKRDRRSIPRVNQLIIESGRNIKPTTTTYKKEKSINCNKKTHFQLANLPVSTRSVNAVDADNVFAFTGALTTTSNNNYNNNYIECPHTVPAAITNKSTFFPSFSDNESDRKFSTPYSGGYTNCTTGTIPVNENSTFNSNKTILLPGQCNM